MIQEYSKAWVIGNALKYGIYETILGTIGYREPSSLYYDTKTGVLSNYYFDGRNGSGYNLNWEDYNKTWFIDKEFAETKYNILQMFKSIKKEYVVQKKKTLTKEIAALDKPIKMAIIQVGHIPASDRYVKNKLKDCEEVGIECNLVELPETVSEESLLNLLRIFNNDETLTGYLVQLPLPKHISEEKIKLNIAPDKDIDGFNPLSQTVPATPLGIINYLKDIGYELKDKNAVVIGRSNIVGKPMAQLLLKENCNVTVLHSKTSMENKKHYINSADLIIVATGHEHTLTDKDFIYRLDTIIIDVGINVGEDGKLHGDCDPDLTCGFQSPVPGGVGLLTRLAVIDNLLLLAKASN